MPRKKTKYTIATLDFETDPFRFGRIPKPFVVELYCDRYTFVAWGDDCVEKLLEQLEKEETPLLIYAHNGGKFDYHFMHEGIDNPIKIINARIVECALGIHTLRDSFAIIPVALKAYAKDDIDYSKMERAVREKNKDEILKYLHVDCIRLFELVTAFNEQFGNKLTVGSTAMTEIKKVHTFSKMNQKGDEIFRQFYYGGRVQCFKSGILDGPWQGYDVNSQYPNAMRNKKHPVNCAFSIRDTLPEGFDNPYFVHFKGRNYNALPCKSDEADGLTFEIEKGDFYACSHEIEIALKYGLIEIEDIYECYVAEDTIQFIEYVDLWYERKVQAKLNKDKIGELFAKFMLNSGYGKFGQNPANFADWLLWRDFGNEIIIESEGYELVSEFPSFELWKRPAEISDTAFYDVSIAASITSAARATLLEGIQNAVDPIYCDTDSLICREFRGRISDTELGAWKHEFSAPSLAIGGKKMYAAYDGDTLIKKASKGGTLTLADLKEICRGGRVSVANQAPTFSLMRPTSFITRTYSATSGKSGQSRKRDYVPEDEALPNVPNVDSVDIVD